MIVLNTREIYILTLLILSKTLNLIVLSVNPNIKIYITLCLVLIKFFFSETLIFCLLNTEKSAISSYNATNVNVPLIMYHDSKQTIRVLKNHIYYNKITHYSSVPGILPHHEQRLTPERRKIKST